MKTILFQGDSITDTGRNREDCSDLGCGYAQMAAARLGLTYPGEYTFLNRGIGGNRSIDVYARMQEDIIDLKPDYISFLLGANDTYHAVHYKSVSDEKFERIYTMMLEEIFEKLPDVKVMLLEPFGLPGAITEPKGFLEEMAKKAVVAKRVAEKFSLPFISLQTDLGEFTKKVPNNYWLRDGVHPTAYFHQYIADRWIDMFETKLK